MPRKQTKKRKAAKKRSPVVVLEFVMKPRPPSGLLPEEASLLTAFAGGILEDLEREIKNTESGEG